MAMPDIARRYTRDEVLAFPDDGNKYELVHGELLVTPVPTLRHQVIVQRVYIALYDYLKPFNLHETAFCLPGDISWDEYSLVHPDLFVAVPDELKGPWSSVRTLLLAAEVLSPSSARGDRVLKRRLYQENHVDTYWIVDFSGGLVEVWRPDDAKPEIVTDTLRWQPRADTPPLELDLPRLFENLPTAPPIPRPRLLS